MPISYSGLFEATVNGFWEGHSKFRYNLATYSFSLTAYSATAEVFSYDMWEIFKGLEKWGKIAETQTLGDNLLLWMSLVFVANSSSAQRFVMTGNPMIIFDREYTDAVVSSVKGNCNVSSTTSFEPISGQMTISWVYKDFVAEPLCYGAMQP
eukprot:gene32909-biopygen28043